MADSVTSLIDRLALWWLGRRWPRSTSYFRARHRYEARSEWEAEFIRRVEKDMLRINPWRSHQ